MTEDVAVDETDAVGVAVAVVVEVEGDVAVVVAELVAVMVDVTEGVVVMVAVGVGGVFCVHTPRSQLEMDMATIRNDHGSRPSIGMTRALS